MTVLAMAKPTWDTTFQAFSAMQSWDLLPLSPFTLLVTPVGFGTKSLHLAAPHLHHYSCANTSHLVLSGLKYRFLSGLLLLSPPTCSSQEPNQTLETHRPLCHPCLNSGVDSLQLGHNSSSFKSLQGSCLIRPPRSSHAAPSLCYAHVTFWVSNIPSSSLFWGPKTCCLH